MDTRKTWHDTYKTRAQRCMEAIFANSRIDRPALTGWNRISQGEKRDSKHNLANWKLTSLGLVKSSELYFN